MRARDRKRHQLGRFWLYQRPDTRTWFICWLDTAERGAIGADGERGRDVTRRKAIGVAGGGRDTPPAEAVDALTAHYLEYGSDRRLKREEALVETLIADWLKHHVAGLDAPERYLLSVRHWLAFFDDELRAGHVAGKVTVAALTPDLIGRFIARRQAEGVGGHSISRDLAALRGPLRWAWKSQKIESVPFIPDIPSTQKARPRERVLAFAEIARLMEQCVGHEDREHGLRFMVLELATAGRPDAILELTSANVDLINNRIDPNQPGRLHLRKRRAIVPIARHARPWLEGIEGKIITYRAPIAERNRQPGGPTHEVRDVASIKTLWRTICHDAKVTGATPKTLRHTMLTWLAKKGVPKEQRQMFAGHAPTGTTAENYEHLTPDYLRDAIRAVDAFFVELGRHTKAHLRSGYDPSAIRLKVVGGRKAA